MISFKDTIRKHINISFTCDGMLTEERINEMHGLFDGAESIVDEIIAKATQELNEGKKAFIVAINSFFAPLHLYFNVTRVNYNENRVGRGGYKAASASYSSVTGKLRGAEFIFKLKLYPEESIGHYRALFYHELTHAYEDWNRRKNKRESLYKHSDRLNYYNNDFSIDNDTIWTAVKRVIYFLHDTEERAYMAMLKGVLQSGEPLYDAKQCYEKIKATKPYQFYIDVEKWVEEIKRCADPKIQNRIVGYFKSHGYPELKTYRGLCNVLDKKLFNVKEKLGKTTGKVIFDYIEKLKKGTQDWGMEYD